MELELHERELKVEKASAELGLVIVEFAREHDLTRIELLQALNEVSARSLKYALRVERHGTADKPAGLQ